MTKLPEIYHSVKVYLFNNKFYVIPQAALPPILLWSSIEPMMEVVDYESKTLAQALELAKEKSKSRFDPAHADPSIKSLSGRKKEVHQVWNQSSKRWSIWWTEDGSINFETLIPDKIYRGYMQWKVISKKIFNPDASIEDVAKQILSERIPTPNKEDLPDVPLLAASFGYKMAWLAIKNTTPEAVIKSLKLPDVQVIDWDDGIDKIYENHGNKNVFLITPQIKGWVFIVGWYLFDLNKPDGKLEWLKERMVDLSKIFEEVQAFATHRVSDYHHWLLAKYGKIIRCFACAGTEIFYNEGTITDGERIFNWDNLANDQHGKPWFPNEEDVMSLAEKWSINPQIIEMEDVDGKKCYLVTLPFHKE